MIPTTKTLILIAFNTLSINSSIAGPVITSGFFLELTSLFHYTGENLAMKYRNVVFICFE